MSTRMEDYKRMMKKLLETARKKTRCGIMLDTPEKNIMMEEIKRLKQLCAAADHKATNGYTKEDQDAGLSERESYNNQIAELLSELAADKSCKDSHKKCDSHIAKCRETEVLTDKQLNILASHISELEGEISKYEEYLKKIVAKRERANYHVKSAEHKAYTKEVMRWEKLISKMKADLNEMRSKIRGNAAAKKVKAARDARAAAAAEVAALAAAEEAANRQPSETELFVAQVDATGAWLIPVEGSDERFLLVIPDSATKTIAYQIHPTNCIDGVKVVSLKCDLAKAVASKVGESGIYLTSDNYTVIPIELHRDAGYLAESWEIYDLVDKLLGIEEDDDEITPHLSDITASVDDILARASGAGFTYALIGPVLWLVTKMTDRIDAIKNASRCRVVGSALNDDESGATLHLGKTGKLAIPLQAGQTGQSGQAGPEYLTFHPGTMTILDQMLDPTYWPEAGTGDASSTDSTDSIDAFEPVTAPVIVKEQHSREQRIDQTCTSPGKGRNKSRSKGRNKSRSKGKGPATNLSASSNAGIPY